MPCVAGIVCYCEVDATRNLAGAARMKVLNVMMSRKRGGLERAALDAHEGLASAGATVTSVLPPHSWIVENWKAGLPCSTLRSFGTWDPVAPTRLRALAASSQAGAILCHGNRAIATAQKARRLAPVIAVCHTTNYSVLKMLDAIDGAIVLTPHYRDKLLEAGFPESRIRLVPNAIRLGPEPPAPFTGSDVTIGALGRIAPNKGFDVLIAACRKLADAGLKVRCIIGGVDLEGKVAELSRLRAEAGLSEQQVVLPGWIADPAAFLRSLDIFVMPSRREVLSIALLEALESGRPIVCTRVPGLESVFDEGVEGLFVDIEDAQGLADAIATLVQDRPRAIAMGAAARARARSYDLPVIGHRLAQALAELVSVPLPERGLIA
jgi:glycosyltransferase involved in cell wall biosynthesis